MNLNTNLVGVVKAVVHESRDQRSFPNCNIVKRKYDDLVR